MKPLTCVCVCVRACALARICECVYPHVCVRARVCVGISSRAVVYLCEIGEPK